MKPRQELERSWSRQQDRVLLQGHICQCLRTWAKDSAGGVNKQAWIPSPPHRGGLTALLSPAKAGDSAALNCSLKIVCRSC